MGCSSEESSILFKQLLNVLCNMQRINQNGVIIVVSIFLHAIILYYIMLFYFISGHKFVVNLIIYFSYNIKDYMCSDLLKMNTSSSTSSPNWGFIVSKYIRDKCVRLNHLIISIS